MESLWLNSEKVHVLQLALKSALKSSQKKCISKGIFITGGNERGDYLWENEKVGSRGGSYW